MSFQSHWTRFRLHCPTHGSGCPTHGTGTSSHGTGSSPHGTGSSSHGTGSSSHGTGTSALPKKPALPKNPGPPVDAAQKVLDARRHDAVLRGNPPRFATPLVAHDRQGLQLHWRSDTVTRVAMWAFLLATLATVARLFGGTRSPRGAAKPGDGPSRSPASRRFRRVRAWPTCSAQSVPPPSQSPRSTRRPRRRPRRRARRAVRL